MNGRHEHDTEYFDTIVIGGGQTGLTVGYELAQRDIDFVILDAADRVGDAWRKRWDSLMLFIPARYASLPGMPFPAEPEAYLSKDDLAEYLERYAEANDLPVRSGTRVTRLSHEGDAYVVETGGGALRAANVVVAMANYQVPHVPEFAPDLDPNIVQMHSSRYKRPSQLVDGPVLVVGMGNSGADIGLELARDRSTYISGEPAAVIPFRIERWFGRKIGVRLVRFGAIKVLNTSTPIGRRARARMMAHHTAAPLVRVKPRDLEAAGAHRVARVSGVRDGLPELADGTALDVANVVWCTGFRPGFDWIDLPVFDEDGEPTHERGIVASQPGLYFCGLFFLHALWSETLSGMPIDARHVVEHLVSRKGAVLAI
ncbi:MAG TPA: NAD(P)-binding domain-containing protein [Acidimicrobiia bacterium]|nr:NAD(P)-binding domain-containing protein [Acidimicrobiia bacterium]